MAAAMELTQMQLYQVAEKVDPDDWVDLGIRLGFEFNHIKQMKEECRGNVRDGIFKMLETWLGMHPNYTKPDARKFLADQFKAMKKMDLAYLLTKTDFSEVGFVPPHNVKSNEMSREFEYEVRSFQKELELSFSIAMESMYGPVSLSRVLQNLNGPGEFANHLSSCMHVLGLRLTRIDMGGATGSSIKFTVAANDEDGVKELRLRLMATQNHFADDLKRIICRYVSFDIDVSALPIQTTFPDQKFGEAIEFFRREARNSFVDDIPSRISNIEIVRLAQELDANKLTLLGLELGLSEAGMSNFQSQGRSCRSIYENILFGWKSTQHPCKEDRSELAAKLEAVDATLLADKLRRGEMRETELEEQRRIYLGRASAARDLKEVMKSGLIPFMKHPKAPTDPYPGEAPAASQAQQHHGYVNYPQGADLPMPHADMEGSRTEQRSQVNTGGMQDEGRPHTSQNDEDPDYARVIYRPCPARPPTTPPEIVPKREEPLYDTMRGEPRPFTSPAEEDHTYENDTLPRTRPVERRPEKRTSHKRHGTSTIPVIHSIDFSVLDGMWDSLAMKHITRSDTEHPAGLARLAQTLQELGQSDIADTVWTALIKDYMKNDYLRRFVTGSIKVLPWVITNKQEIDIGKITPLEDVLGRTKSLEFPSRIFIEADKPEDREMIAEKLGYDWAMEKDPNSPLGNVDLLYVLNVADIAPGSTVGGAVESQRVCKDFKLSPDRVEDYFKNTCTENMIVLKGDKHDFQRLMSFDSQGSKKAGFRELVKGEYLGHCIVIMTVEPQAIEDRPKSFVYYKLESVSTSDC